ncbi:MAG: hypothetical protein WKH64_02110 [Chloroflexia bacterium]
MCARGLDRGTQRLRDAGVVRRPVVFRASFCSRALAQGCCRASPPGTSTRDVIAALTDPDNQATITVPEGWRIEQTGERLWLRGWRRGIRGCCEKSS